MPTNNELGVDDGEIWYNKETGEVFDAGSPIYEDMVLCVKDVLEQKEPEDDCEPTPVGTSIRAYLKYEMIGLFIILLFVMMGVMIVIDRRNTYR